MSAITKSQRAQLAALDLAIAALRREGRKLYFMGYVAYTQQKITDMTFAVSGYKNYTKYMEAVRQLEDFKELILDPGVMIDDRKEKKTKKAVVHTRQEKLL